MSALEELRKKLYGREEPEQRMAEKGALRFYSRRKEEPKTFWVNNFLASAKKNKAITPKKRWVVNLLIFSLVIFLGILSYVGYEIFFARDEVNIVIAGPEAVEVGGRTDFSIFIKNTGNVRLAEVELNIAYPEHSIPLSSTGEQKKGIREVVAFEKIGPGEEIKYDAALRVLGKIGGKAALNVLVEYRPENIQSRLTKKASKIFEIIRTPFVISVIGPDEVSAGQELLMTFQVNSEAEPVLGDLAFRIDYPQGFGFVSADPKPDFDNNIWLLGSLVKGNANKIAIRGVLSGEPEEIKSFNAVLGQYNHDTRLWLAFLEESKGPKIASPFLFLRQTVNERRGGTIAGGESLRFSIFYRNNLSRRIENAVITAKLSEEVLNLRTLTIDGGSYDPVSHEIRWSAATLQELKEIDAGETGSVSFSVALRPSPPLISLSDKNFTLVSQAAIDTISIPEELRGAKLRYEDRIEFKISTELAMNVRAAYFDSPVENSGPLPPKVRQDTTYTIFWQVANQSNDAVNVRVHGGLPANVKWLGTVGEFPGAAVFNEAAGEVVWNVPRISAGTGILKPQATLIFRLALTPGEDQIGTSPILVGKIMAEAVDDFTKEPLKVDAVDVTTELNADKVRDVNQWRVVP